MNEKIMLIVGLGNPGAQYEHTRHNAGADFVAELVNQCREQFRPESKFHGLYSKINIADSQIHCLIPTTFMNRSGQAVAAISRFFKIPDEAILIAHDELDIPPGSVKLKFGGGHGGHNGLRDIISHLSTNHFARLRLGIGHPGNSQDVANYVLKTASVSDRKLMEQVIDATIH
ncbi:MAG: aminoacyl-tRNA hydrolase, partial [Pseudomonadales bacterium]|nr:aminoacyl-tRNA hydrolase [Pseudomonadales bacterium]